MSHSTSIYFVEVLEDGKDKRVPHTKGTKHTDFLDRASAKEFLDQLIANNSGYQFRLVKETTTYTYPEWQKPKK